MLIDFSLLDAVISPVSSPNPAPNDDVAYLRHHLKAFIRAVDAQERLHMTLVRPLPFGTWNAAVVLQPANVVLKLSPWSDRFEADFLNLASKVAAPVPQCMAYGTVPDQRLPQASYVLMQYIANSCPAGPIYEHGGLSEPELTSIGRRLGITLAQLHTMAFPHVRHFDDASVDWGTCLALWEPVETALFDGWLLTRFVQILDQTHYREQKRGTLTHSNANLHNILIDETSNQFQALIDPGPMIVGLPMYDLAYAVQPWRYGRGYQNAVVNAYQAAGGVIDMALFYTSQLCVAYQQSRYFDPKMVGIRSFLESDILPCLT